MEDSHEFSSADIILEDTDPTAAPKGRGRLRICKQCKFTCTDSIEFLQHQTKAHGEHEDSQSSNKKNSIRVANLKKRSSRSESEISMESLVSEKMNGEEFQAGASGMDLMNDDNEDGRLIIAEDQEHFDGQDPSSVTPTRCGNIQNRTYVCSVCEFTSTSAKTYLHHQKDEHKYDFIIYECDICEYATKYKQKLPRHRKLHFSGQEGLLLQASGFEDTPNTSSLNHSQDEDTSALLGEDEDEEIEEEDEEPVTTVIPQAVPEVTTPVVNGEKKKKTRQEVDPAKYFEVVDDTGIKYACSSCGNVYKWRKSLNKHWKEKHSAEIPDGSKRPPGLMYLVNSGNHTMHGKRRIYSNSVLASMTQPSSAKPSSHTSSPSLIRAETPVSMVSLANRPSPTMSDYSEPSSSQPVVFPKFIGPFVNNTPSPAYSSGTGNSLREYVSAHIERQRKEAENERKTFTDSERKNAKGSQDQPLDFSCARKDDIQTLDPNFFKVKMEPLWSGDDDYMKGESCTDDVSKNSSAILQCTKCAFVAKTLVDYSSHMTLHLNRRAFKCAVCQEHFNGVEDLNKHFLEEHAEKIQEHKEAIQKIPHGLQQTYHLLKMPLDAITHLSSQDLTNTDSKQLKCNMCDFVAKWPAELQKHAVSHSEERPFMCMVCGSTYKWKWDLVKHFEKSHHTLPNPYKRRETGGGSKSTEQGHSPEDSLIYSTSLDDLDEHMASLHEGEPMSKRRRMSDSDMPELIPKPRDDDHIAVFDESRDLGMHKRLLDAPFLRAERPSSVPTNIESYGDHDSSNEGSLKDLKISNVHSLHSDELEYLLEKSDAECQIQRPVSSETQKAIAAAVRQRLLNSDNLKGDEIDFNSNNINSSCANILLPYKCPKCEYRARWPSEITQHMKNHSDEKPYHCPRCSYRSKWKWDVVKHLKRCGGGTIKDVIDTSKGTYKRMAPPNVTVLPEGNIQQQTPQPVAYLLSSNTDPATGQSAVIVPILAGQNQTTPPLVVPSHGTTPIQPKPSITSAVQPNKSPVSQAHKQPVFRSLINQGLYHCLECPFIGHSPAELKRHSVLHSENKPFTCETCGYSSRWKCDLKKHMKIYNHFSSQASVSPDLNGDDSFLTDSDDPERVEKSESRLFMCNKCPYTATKQDALDNHMKVHNSSFSSPAKFKCKQCNFQVNDLSTFLQHRVAHSVMNSANSAQSSHGQLDGQKPDDLDEARLKHPRKAVKRIYCSKCNFVCTKRETMDMHEAEHEKELKFKCFYCDMTVNDKESLLDHITSHSEFNPDEWETFFMDEDQSDQEGMESASDSKKDNHVSDAIDLTVPSPPPLKMFSQSQQRFHSDTDQHLTGPPQLHIPRFMQNSSQNRSSTPKSSFTGHRTMSSMHSRNIPQHSTSNSGSPGMDHSNFRSIQPAPAPTLRKRYTCEWCEAMFAHISTLYQHAKNVHPLELRQQEMSEAAKTLAQSQSRQHHQDRLRYIEQKWQQYQLSKLLRSQESPDKLSDKPKPSSMFDKNQEFLESLQHSENNDDKISSSHNISNMTIESLMKAKKTTSPQRKARAFQCTKCPFTAPNAVTYLRHVERHGSNCKHTCWFCDYSIDRLNLLYQHMRGSHSEQWKGSEHDVRISSSPTPTYPIVVEDDAETMDKVRTESLSNSFSKHKPILTLKQQTTWRGIPIQICSINERKHYKCPKCSYINSNIANAANHVRQHGSNRKYQCKYCDYCSDNLKLIYQHMDKVHPKEPAFIEVTKNVEVGSIEDTDEKDRFEIEGDMEGSENENEFMTCPKCPFKATMYDIYRAHVLMHSYNGQYKCEHCDYSVDDLTVLTHHSVVHEEETKEKKTDSPLTPEKKRFTSMLNLKKVDEKMQSSTALVSSPSKSAEIASKLLTMQARQVLQKSRLNGRVRYKCSRCPYNTFCKNNIIKHRKQHIIKSRYKCPLCNYSASRAYLLQQHIKFHKTENNNNDSAADKNYQDVVMDPLDKNSKELKDFEVDPEESKDEETEDVGSDEEMEMIEGEMDEGEGDEVSQSSPVEENEKLDESVPEEKAGSSAPSTPSIKTYKCNDCPFSSNSSTEFQKHGMFHGAAHKFKCEFCSYSLDRLNLLTQHRRLHSDEPEFDPAPPPSALLNLKALRMNASPEKNREKVSSSLDTEMSEYEVEVMRHACSKCPFKSNALKSYNVHYQMHGLNKKYVCDYCDWSIDRLNLLYQHRRVHAKEPGFVYSPAEINILNRNFAIETPGKFQAQVMNFGKSSHTESDQKVKENEKKDLFKCKNCPFTTSNKNSFAYHRVLHRMRARYMCPECSYSVDRWNLLNQHLRLHQEAKKLKSDELFKVKCPKCPFATQSTENLELHAGSHGAECKFNCHFCDFSVENGYQLEEHLKLHEGTKKLMSPPAGENGDYDARSPDVVNPQLYFSSPDDNNISDDSEETELKCDRCPFSTTSKDELDHHENQHNNANSLPCCYCDFSCAREDELQTHIQVHFPGTPVDKDMIKNITAKYRQEKNNNSLKDTPKSKSKTETSTPDSTVEEEQKSNKTSSDVEKPNLQPNKLASSTETRTKVYVCQYCEREFENKTLMMQHERQHLIGQQY